MQFGCSIRSGFYGAFQKMDEMLGLCEAELAKMREYLEDTQLVKAVSVGTRDILNQLINGEIGTGDLLKENFLRMILQTREVKENIAHILQGAEGNRPNIGHNLDRARRMLEVLPMPQEQKAQMLKIFGDIVAVLEAQRAQLLAANQSLAERGELCPLVSNAISAWILEAIERGAPGKLEIPTELSGVQAGW